MSPSCNIQMTWAELFIQSAHIGEQPYDATMQYWPFVENKSNPKGALISRDFIHLVEVKDLLE